MHLDHQGDHFWFPWLVEGVFHRPITTKMCILCFLSVLNCQAVSQATDLDQETTNVFSVFLSHTWVSSASYRISPIHQLQRLLQVCANNSTFSWYMYVCSVHFCEYDILKLPPCWDHVVCLRGNFEILLNQVFPCNLVCKMYFMVFYAICSLFS